MTDGIRIERAVSDSFHLICRAEEWWSDFLHRRVDGVARVKTVATNQLLNGRPPTFFMAPRTDYPCSCDCLLQGWEARTARRIRCTDSS